MSTDLFELHIQQSLQKLEDLNRRSDAIPATDSTIWQSSDKLPQQQQQILQESLEELSASIEELQLATETLRQQNEELLANRYQLEAERQYYRELFNSAPDCYFLTTKDGIITEANQKTTELLGLSAKYLQKKALAVFISLPQRQEYYTKLNQLKSGKITEATWQLDLTPRQQNPITVKSMVTAIENSLGTIIGLRWRISPLSTKEESDPLINLPNVTEILVDRLRYPLYNLATKIEELRVSEGLEGHQIKSLQGISHDVLELKQVVDDVYILDRLNNREDLNPSLVDYTVFVNRLIQKFQQRYPQKQFVFNCQNTHVGICDVFLLATIVKNLLNNARECSPLNSQIEVNLALDSFQYLVLQFKYQTSPTATPNQGAITESLADSSNLEQPEDINFKLIVVQKSVALLAGEMEIKQQDNTHSTVTVKLPVR